jgi:hypothetical protein
MTDYFDYDPLVLARMVERDLRSRTSASARRRRDGNDPFLEQLRKHLYANYRRPRERTTLDAIADLVASGSARGSVEAVVTFNFDDLLERALVRRGVSIQSITSGDRQVHGGVKVIHAHGYLPRVGPLSRCDIVFTELDYHRLTESVFHWGLSEIVEHLRKSTVLFIGLSMADPSLRRLLDASRNSKIPPHWQIQRRHDIRDHEMADAMAEVERRARRYATLLGSGREETKTPAALEDSIRAALGQADSYDRDVFEGMGVKTIWVTGFGEIADIVAAIARK